MTPAAIKAAAKVGFPRDKIVAVWWGGSEEDVIPAGDAAKGYIAGSFASDGVGFPVIQDIQKTLYANGKGQSVGPGRHRHGQLQPWRDRRDHDGGSHPRGTRQVRQKALNGDEVRWGLEHLDLSPPA